MTQEEVAQKSGVALRSYQYYETGERVPDILTAIRIADTLHVKDIRKLFGAATLGNAKEAVVMYPPGSRKFFESIAIPGIKVKSIHAFSGHVHIVLLASAGSDMEILRKQYLNACTSQNSVGQEISVSIERLNL